MKKRLFLLFTAICIFCVIPLSAQPSIEWQKTLGGNQFDAANSICETSDGGSILAGYTLSNNGDVTGNHGGYDFWVVKLNETGNVQWKKSLGGSDNEWAYSIQQTKDEGYIVAGFTESNNGDVSGNHGDKDCWVVKLSNAGTIEWQKTLGGSGWEEAWSIRQTFDGGYIMAGRTTSSDGDVTGYHGGFDFWIVKLNGSGNLEWQKAFGGSSIDIAYSIRQASDEGYIITGESDSTDGDAVGLHNTASDYWVIKLNTFGELQWQRMLGSTSQDRANDIYITSDGGYIVAGIASGSDGDLTEHYGGYDYWIVKLNNIGEIQWQKSLGGTDEDFAQAILQTKNGDFIVTGYTRSEDGHVLDNDGGQDIWIVKLNIDGNMQWQKTLGGTQEERANSILQSKDQGIIIAGRTWSNDGDVSGNHGNRDFWAVKLSPETTRTTSPIIQVLEVTPNPAEDFAIVQLTAEDHQVRVWDSFGKKYYQTTASDTFKLETANWQSGIYFIETVSVNVERRSGKLVIQH